MKFGIVKVKERNVAKKKIQKKVNELTSNFNLWTITSKKQLRADNKVLIKYIRENYEKAVVTVEIFTFNQTDRKTGREIYSLAHYAAKYQSLITM